MNPADLLKVADDLAARAADGAIPRDAGFRTATGRYYYAALLESRAFLEETTPGRVDRSARTHAWVAAQLDGADPEMVELRRLLGELRGWRTSADYGDELRISPEAMSKSAAKKARRALKRLKTLRSRAE